MIFRPFFFRQWLPLLLAVPLAGAHAGELRLPDGGHYSGPLVAGLAQGKGVVTWDNGARYEGGFEAGLYTGEGRLVLPGGAVYEGQFRKGMMAGRGLHTLRSGAVYAGDFADNTANGHGRLELPGSYVYEGEFRDGSMEGKGRLDGRDGIYEGEFRNNQFWGKGELTYKDGRKYRGDFVHDVFQGRGRYELPDGFVYEGDFAEGQFTGQGTFSSKANGHHEGGFVNWRPQGKGKRTDPEGVVYEGEFEAGDLRKGRMTAADGSWYEGALRQFKPQGQGTLHLVNGDVYVGGFAYGYYDGQGTLTLAKPDAEGRLQISGVWRYGELKDDEVERKRLANVEAALYGQGALLDQALAAVLARDPGRINLYLLAVAGDGQQEVFHRETEFVRQQFDARFGTRGRSLLLVNSRNTVATVPMATLTSLQRGIDRMAAQMDREKDILFLYLTSHGSRDKEFVLDQDDMELADLRAADLGRMLRDSGIRWRVLVISSCYSGGFIDDLKDDHTLVITAARHDRTSFGCSDENDFTYFGRAFFKEALPGSRSFQDAFRQADKLVSQWESEGARGEAGDGGTESATRSKGKAKDQPGHSLPQMVSAPAIDAYLKVWWKQMLAARTASPPPAGGAAGSAR